MCDLCTYYTLYCAACVQECTMTSLQLSALMVCMISGRHNLGAAAEADAIGAATEVDPVGEQQLQCVQSGSSS